MAIISETMKNIGYWSTSEGLVLNDNNAWEIKSFEGKHFKVAILPVCTVSVNFLNNDYNMAVRVFVET
jgi:hypothetical protein